MKASLLLPSIALFSLAVCSGSMLCNTAAAEYPFDPFDDSGALDPLAGPGFDGGNLAGDAYAADPFLNADPSFPAGDLFAAETPIWPGWISATFQPGTERVIYNGEIVQPLYQDGRTMWYLDFRGQGDEDSASEFNLGTGVRTLADPGWIFGGYVFWDHLNSSHGNSFNQGTIGFEAMDVFWDVRFNVYFPESKAKVVGTPQAIVSGGNIVLRSGLERAYWGTDFEVGNLLWAWGPAAQQELRGFLALYHFDHSANPAHSISGPRARLEWRCYDLPYFGPGSRFTLGLSVQHDRVRNGQLFAFARMRIPLDPWAHSRRRLSPLHRRMLDTIVRDVDVVSATASRTEAAVNAHTGRTISGYRRIDATTPEVGNILNSLNDDALIVIDGSRGDVKLAHEFALKPGQTVLGGGSSLPVRGASSRRMVTFEASGSRPTVDFGTLSGQSWTHNGGEGNAPSDLIPTTGFSMDDRTHLSGVDITNAQTGVTIAHDSDVLVKDVSVEDFLVTGIAVSDSQRVSLDGVHVRDQWTRPPSSGADFAQGAGETSPSYHPASPFGVGISVQDSSDVHVRDSSVRNVAAAGIRVVRASDVKIERTSIAHTRRDGVRLIETERVLLGGLDLKNIGEAARIESNQGGGSTQRYVAGVTMTNTRETLIADTHIKQSPGLGIIGDGAVSTHIDDVAIFDVRHGILFHDSHDLEISNTAIVLPQTPIGPFMPYLYQLPHALPHDHTGIFLSDMSGEVAVHDSSIQGGAGDGLVYWGLDEQTTNLLVADNFIERSVYGGAVWVRTANGHRLNAQILHNELRGVFGSAGFLFRDGSDVDLLFADNLAAGRFDMTTSSSSTVKADIAANRFEGDPPGSVQVTSGGALRLQFDGNTSASGAEPFSFRNDGGAFKLDLGQNDFAPELHGVIDAEHNGESNGSKVGDD